MKRIATGAMSIAPGTRAGRAIRLLLLGSAVQLAIAVTGASPSAAQTCNCFTADEIVAYCRGKTPQSYFRYPEFPSASTTSIACGPGFSKDQYTFGVHRATQVFVCGKLNGFWPMSKSGDHRGTFDEGRATAAACGEALAEAARRLNLQNCHQSGC